METLLGTHSRVHSTHIVTLLFLLIYLCLRLPFVAQLGSDLVLSFHLLFDLKIVLLFLHDIFLRESRVVLKVRKSAIECIELFLSHQFSDDFDDWEFVING